MSTNIKKKNGNKPEKIKDEDILREQCKQIEDKINTVKDQKLGRVGSIFKIKKYNGSKERYTGAYSCQTPC